MATNNYDLILRFLLDQSSQQKTKAGVDQLTGDIGDVEKVVHAANKELDALEQKLKEATSVDEMKSLEAQLRKIEEQLRDVDSQVKETTKAYSNQARVLRAEAAAITSDFEKARIAQIRSISDKIGGVSRTGLVAGTAVVGGILAEANRFAKEAEGADKAAQATRDWTKATQELAAARAKVDAVLLRESLPLLQQAARIATEAASFIEKNPEIVQAALKVGVIVAGLGAIGVAVSKGIRLYADVQALLLGGQELAAAKLQDIAADKQLIAARLRAGMGGVDAPGGGRSPGGGNLPLILSAILAGGSAYAALGRGASNFGARAFGFESPEAFWKQMAEKLRLVKQEADKTADSLGRVSDGLGGVRGTKGGRNMLRVVGSEAETQRNDAIVKIFSDWREDDARLIQEAADNRRKVIESSERAIAEATRKYAQQRVSINAQFDKRRAELVRDFAEDSKKAELDYATERAKIIRDAGEDIRQIEADHQEQIRKMTLEHNDRVEGLTASRDALGLVKEQRRFDRERSEAERGTNQEIAQRRRDVAIRLADLANEFATERAQRQAEFKQAVAENEKNRQEELKQAAQAHTEEMNQLRQQKAERLREIQEGLNAERLRRREVFLAEIRDLDASLLGERNLKVKYYNDMLRDADVWLAAYRAKLASASPTSVRTATTPTNSGGFTSYPIRDEGGYMSKGFYRVAWNGMPEFALSGRTTRAAEQIIGGRLTQESLLQALANAAGSGNSRNLNIGGNWRFDGRISAREVRAIKQDLVNSIAEEFNRA